MENLRYKFEKEVSSKFNLHTKEELYQFKLDGKRQYVIECLLPLVLWHANNMNNKKHHMDLISAGNLGVCKAVDNFNILKNDNIISYANQRIKWEMLDYIARNLDIVLYPYQRANKVKQTPPKPKMLQFINDLYEGEYITFSPEVKVKTIRPFLLEILMLLPGIKAFKANIFLDMHYTEWGTGISVAKKYNITKFGVYYNLSEVKKKLNENPKIKKIILDLLEN